MAMLANPSPRVASACERISLSPTSTPNGIPKPAPQSRPLPQRRHPKFARQLVELREQRRRQRYAVAQTFDATVAAAIARQADAVNAGQPLRATQIGEMAISLGHKGRERNEALDVDRNHEMAGVSLAILVVVEIDDIAAEGGAVEHAAQEAQHDGEAAALVAADREQQPLGATPWIGQGAS